MNETNETKWLRTIGVDLHKCSMTIAVLDELGQQFDEKEIPTKCRNQIRDFFSSYGLQAQVAVESVGFYHWFWNLVRPLVGKMILANPTALAPFRGRKAKTDRKDARLIAELLFQGRLPTAFVPSESIRTLRELLRHRHSLARALATERRHLGWIGLKNNLTGPTSWTSDRAQKWLLAQEDKLSPAHRFAARQRLDHIVRLQRDVLDAERLVAQTSQSDPALLRQAALLQSVPGIGWLTAMTILVETGELTRFDHPDPLSAFAGLVPRVWQSGQSEAHGHISKAGPPVLRWVLQQAAWAAIHHSERIRAKWVRLSKRAGSQRAALAIARQLLIYAWSVARRGEPFHWPDQPVPAEEAGRWSYEI
jgi:transposase